MGGADDVPIVSPLVSGAVNEAQAQVQSFFFGIRKDVFKYDEAGNVFADEESREVRLWFFMALLFASERPTSIKSPTSDHGCVFR